MYHWQCTSHSLFPVEKPSRTPKFPFQQTLQKICTVWSHLFILLSGILFEGKVLLLQNFKTYKGEMWLVITITSCDFLFLSNSFSPSTSSMNCGFYMQYSLFNRFYSMDLNRVLHSLIYLLKYTYPIHAYQILSIYNIFSVRPLEKPRNWSRI